MYEFRVKGHRELIALHGWEGLDRLSRELFQRYVRQLHPLYRSATPQAGDHDEHLFAFWLSGDAYDGEPRTTGDEAALDELDLVAGQKIAYVWDMGEEIKLDLVVETAEL